MLKTFFLIGLPIFSFWVFSVKIFIEIWWLDFQNFPLLVNTTLDHKSVKRFKRSGVVFNKLLVSNLVTLILFFTFVLKFYSFEINMFYINSFIFKQAVILCVTFVLILWFLGNLTHTVYTYNSDIMFFLSQSLFTTIMLLFSHNIFMAFLSLEVLNVLIIYSFLSTTVLNILSIESIGLKELWVVKTAIYQFILNFFSSIVFFWSFNIIVATTQTSNFFFLAYVNFSNANLIPYMVVFYLAFFLKLGMGPWIFFKLEIYQNFNFLLLLVYTCIYFLGVLVFFYNMFFIYGMPVTTKLSIVFLTILLCVAIKFSLIMFTYYNIYVFFSFSSLLHLILFSIQLFLIFSNI